jgi:hypothetical protein
VFPKLLNGLMVPNISLLGKASIGNQLSATATSGPVNHCVADEIGQQLRARANDRARRLGDHTAGTIGRATAEGCYL